MAQKTAVNKKNTARAAARAAVAPAPWSDPVIVTAVFAAALIVRVICLYQIEAMPVFYHLPGDSLAYDLWAQKIVAGDWFGQSVFYQAPLYPYFLAGLQFFLGHDLWAIRVAQLVLSAAACVLLYCAGKQWFSRTVGISAAAILCFSAPAVFYGSVIDKTVTDLFLTCLLLAVLGWVAAGKKWPGFLAMGVVLGLLALSRENTLVWFALVPIWIWFHFGALPAAWRVQRLGLFLAGLAMVLLPVGLRNFAVGGQFTLTTAQMGPNFYIGNNPSADGMYSSIRLATGEKQFEQAEAQRLAEQVAGRVLSPKQVSDYWLGRSLEYIRERPLDWLRLLWRKWLIVWNTREIEDSDDFYLYQQWSWLLAALAWVNHFGILAPLAAAGVVASLRQWRRLWLLYLLVLSFAASVALFFIFGRYRFPLVPFLALFAAAALLQSVAWFKRRQYKELARCAAVLLAAGLMVHWPVVGRPGPSAPGYTYLANGYAKQGKIDEAIRSAQAALAVDPNYGVAHYNLANLYVDMERLSEAVAHYREALKVYPRYLEAHGNLSRALTLMGQLPEAAAQYRAALKLQPGDARIRLGYGEVLARQGSYHEAMEQFAAVLKNDPNSAPAHGSLGRVLAAQGDFVRATEHFRHAVRIAPDSSQAHALLARILAEQGKNTEALRHQQEALRLRANRP